MIANASTARTAFTLIEAIVAMVILSVAVPAMFWAIRDAQRGRADPAMHARARWLAAEKLEDVLADRNSATRGYAYIAAANYPAEAAVAGYPGFARAVAVTESGPYLSGGPSAGSGYKTANVTVTFQDGGGKTIALSLSTVVTRWTP